MSVIIGGLYQHYKGKQYKVIGIANHSETLDPFVVYKACYGNEALWIRPYDMFCEKVMVDGNKIERFKYLGEELSSNCKVFLEIPKDIMHILIENNIDLEREISQEIENIDIQYEQINEEEHKKDVAIVIAVAGMSVSAVLLCVSRLIRTINERPREAKIFEKNAEGSIIKEKTILLEPNKAPFKADFDFEVGTQSIKFKILDGIGEEK